MRVNSISFGKIIQVNAPRRTAEYIARIANNETKSFFLEKPVKAIIDDTEQGSAHACAAYNYETGRYEPESKSYIFSGKEGKKYWESYSQAWKYIDKAYEQNRVDADMLSQIAWAEHRNEVDKMITSAKDIPVMDVQYDRNGNIESVNIIA